MNTEQRTEWYFAHVQDDLNLGILCMFKGTFSLDAAHYTCKTFQVTLLLVNFTHEEHNMSSEEKRIIVDAIYQYNRRFSGEPRSVSCILTHSPNKKTNHTKTTAWSYLCLVTHKKGHWQTVWPRSDAYFFVCVINGPFYSVPHLNTYVANQCKSLAT